MPTRACNLDNVLLWGRTCSLSSLLKPHCIHQDLHLHHWKSHSIALFGNPAKEHFHFPKPSQDRFSMRRHVCHWTLLFPTVQPENILGYNSSNWRSTSSFSLAVFLTWLTSKSIAMNIATPFSLMTSTIYCINPRAVRKQKLQTVREITWKFVT